MITYWARLSKGAVSVDNLSSTCVLHDLTVLPCLGPYLLSLSIAHPTFVRAKTFYRNLSLRQTQIFSPHSRYKNQNFNEEVTLYLRNR